MEFKYPNIKIIKDCEIEQDIYTIINQFDILITDYSSIYFDFLLADKPIIFAPFDYEEYITKDRELYYNYNEVTPGPKCRNWDEVLDWIVKFKENPKLFKEEREKIKKMFHKYQDGKNCERVFNEILNLDKNDKKQKVK
jgi:CDP-glycerol glycerophosphotransferase (TagB/SpsB family)